MISSTPNFNHGWTSGAKAESRKQKAESGGTANRERHESHEQLLPRKGTKDTKESAAMVKEVGNRGWRGWTRIHKRGQKLKAERRKPRDGNPRKTRIRRTLLDKKGRRGHKR